MDISVRRLLAIILALALVAGLALLAAPRLAPLVPELLRRATPTVAPAPPVTQITGPAISYADESLGWDWDVSCEAPFQAFLAERLAGQRIRSVKVVLLDYRDEPKLPFGIQYPDRNGPWVVANCADETLRGDFTCRMAVRSGEPGVAARRGRDGRRALHAPRHVPGPRPEPQRIRKTWGWTVFQPLLTPMPAEANTWQSSCLQLSRAR